MLWGCVGVGVVGMVGVVGVCIWDHVHHAACNWLVPGLMCTVGHGKDMSSLAQAKGTKDISYFHGSGARNCNLKDSGQERFQWRS